jgi:excisionase family DNA binding protein
MATNNSKDSALVERGFATSAEAAVFLGICKSMVNKKIHDGTIPNKRYGRCVRIPWAWLKSEAQAGE